MNVLGIWVVGIVLTLRCAWEIGYLRIPKEKRLMAILLVVLTSWIGAFLYTFFFKEKVGAWLDR